MLSVNTPLREAEMADVQALAPGHPVFKLDGFGANESVVIKQEMGDQRNVMIASTIMRYADPSANQAILSPQEVSEVRRFVNHGGRADILAATGASALRRTLNGPGTWIKMETKRLAGIDNAIAQRFAGVKTELRQMAEALKTTGGLETLGEIIAADLFNANNDRFAYDGQGSKNPNLPVRFRAIWNEGNVLIAIDGNGRGRPIGLDSFDPTSNPVYPHNKVITAADNWPGMMLATNQVNQRRTFAGNVIHDLELALGPRNRKVLFGSTTRLGKNRKNRLLAGLGRGTARIKTTLQRQRNAPGPNLPVSVSSRMTLLGW